MRQSDRADMGPDANDPRGVCLVTVGLAARHGCSADRLHATSGWGLRTYIRRRVQRQPELKCSGTLIIFISNLFLNLVEEIEGRGVTPLDGEDESKRHKGLLSS